MFRQLVPPAYMAGIGSSETADPYNGLRALAIVVYRDSGNLQPLSEESKFIVYRQSQRVAAATLFPLCKNSLVAI